MQGSDLTCGPVPQRLRESVYERDHGYCRYCYRFMAPEHRYHIDHVRPRSLGGPTVLANLVLACPPCNITKRDTVWTPLAVFGDYTSELSDETIKLIKTRRKVRLPPVASPRSAGASRVRQTARLLEHWIRSGEPGYGPGWVLPSAARLGEELDLGGDAVTAAYHQLASMGVVSVRQGYGATVRTPRDREIITVPPGAAVTARMPTFAELDEWELEPGVPMLVADGLAWPADRYEIRVAGEPTAE